MFCILHTGSQPTRSRVHWILFALFAALVIIQVFMPPPVGIANNGDWGKVAGLFDITAPTQDEFRFLVRTWKIDPASHYWGGFVTSEIGLAAIAARLNRVFRRDGLFDIRVMGAVHASLYLLALYLLLPLFDRDLTGVILAAIVTAIFAGTMYAEWMNTFSMDAAELVFLALTAVLYLRCAAWDRTADRIAFAACAILMVTAKLQHAPLAIPLIALIQLHPPWRKRIYFRTRATVLLILAAAATLHFAPTTYAVGRAYDMTFMAILPASQSVETDLRELGLNSSYRDLIGTSEYDAAAPMGRPEFVREFAARTSYPRILWFVLRHPRTGMRIVLDGLNWAGIQRPAMGDYERSTGKPDFTQARTLSPWSNLKQMVFEQHGALYLGYIAVVCGACLALAWRSRYRVGATCLVVATLIAFLIATLGDTVEITRHCFIANTLLDLVVASCAAALLTNHTRPSRDAF